MNHIILRHSQYCVGSKARIHKEKVTSNSERGRLCTGFHERVIVIQCEAPMASELHSKVLDNGKKMVE